MTVCLDAPQFEPTEADRLNEYLETKDPALLTWLYERFNKRLMANARKYMKDKNAAEDCVSEAWLTFMQCAPPSTKANSAFAYLNTMVRWKIISHARQMKTGVRREEVSLDALLEHEDGHGRQLFEVFAPELDEQEEDFHNVWQAIEDQLSKLTPTQREAVELYYCQGLTRLEVAEVMDITSDAAWMQIRRGIYRLRNKLSPDYTLAA